MGYIKYAYLDHRDESETYKAMDDNDYPDKTWKWYLVTIFICLLMPTYFDLLQLYRKGIMRFMGDTGMWIDTLHLLFGYYSLKCQFYDGPLHLKSQLVLIGSVFLCLIKTFQLLKIFE